MDILSKTYQQVFDKISIWALCLFPSLFITPTFLLPPPGRPYLLLYFLRVHVWISLSLKGIRPFKVTPAYKEKTIFPSACVVFCLKLVLMNYNGMILHTGFLLVYFWNLCHVSVHANKWNFESDKPERNSLTTLPSRIFFSSFSSFLKIIYPKQL